MQKTAFYLPIVDIQISGCYDTIMLSQQRIPRQLGIFYDYIYKTFDKDFSQIGAKLPPEIKKNVQTKRSNTEIGRTKYLFLKKLSDFEK